MAGIAMVMSDDVPSLRMITHECGKCFLATSDRPLIWGVLDVWWDE